MNKNVNVSLLSYQKTASEVEEIKVVAVGTYSFINGRHFVRYDEETEDGRTNKILLKFEDGFFEMSKSGEVRSSLSFKEGTGTKGFYNTPYGMFEIKTDTEKLDIDVMEDGISIKLEYMLFIDGEYVADCTIDIKISFI